MKNYLLAIDEGTTGVTSLLMDESLNLVSEASVDFPQHFPQPGWVEHDLEDIWGAVAQTVRDALEKSKINPLAITGIGITNQRETIGFWDKKTGKPLARAIVWQDRRTADYCELLKNKNLESQFQKKTGLLLDPYFSATKVAWALKNWEPVKKAQTEGRLAVGTIDSFLLARLTGNQVHATEPSNASRTLAFDLHSREFSRELCSELGVPFDVWPEVRPTTGLFGKTRGLSFLPDGIPITGMIGDQQSALFGQACIEPGQAKCTYGTGAFLLMNTGNQPVFSTHRLLTTIAWALGDVKDSQNITYALEGSTFVAGAAVQWLRDGLGLFKSSSEIEALAASVPTSEGVTFVPALTGLGAPYWSPDSTGLFTGITRGTTRAHFARAALEGIAFQVYDLLEAMQKDLGKKLVQLHVDGGASANGLLMQFQADLLGTSLKRPKNIETTALGAIFAAGLGSGMFADLTSIARQWSVDRSFEPSRDEEKRRQDLTRWKSAVAKVLLRG